jgi:hypothetical protein
VEGIIVVGVLVLAAGVCFAAGAWQTARVVRDRREMAREDREMATARENATWQVEVRHRGTFTEVVVQRTARMATGWRPLDDAVIVAKIGQDSANYEVELDRAGSTARQRASQLNGFRVGGDEPLAS